MPTIFSACMSWVIPTFFYLFLYVSLLYVLILAIFKIHPNIALEVLFLNRICPPKWIIQLNRPQKKYKLKNAQNYYVKSSSGNTLGVWHIAPTSRYDSTEVDSRSLSEAEKVVIYCHGNAFHRGFPHRCILYKSLASVGYHVVTFDYSGFGDSTGWPKPGVVVKDAVSVYKWTVDQLKRKDATIVFWGHSLGTAISTKALATIQDSDLRLPEGFVLEAPFTNILEAAETFPLSKVFFTLYPFVVEQVRKIFHTNEATLPTEEILPQIQCPILILHAEDDHRIPLFLGEKLYRKTISDPETKSSFIRFIRMHERHEVKHYTATHPEICSIFQDFMEVVHSSKGKGHDLEKKSHEPSLVGHGTDVRFEMIDI